MYRRRYGRTGSDHQEIGFHLEQVQDFTPTPMTVATETWYTGYHPYTLQPVFSAKTPKEKLAQRMFFSGINPKNDVLSSMNCAK